MERFSQKVYLSLSMPDETAPISDHKRIQLALEALGYNNITIPLPLLGKLYPLCRNADFDITVSLVKRDFDWAVVDIEKGDQTGHHYALAVDYGSTTVVMRMLDMNTGCLVGEEKALNEQAKYGTDILTRITYSMEDPRHAEDLHGATVDTFHNLLRQLSDATGIDAARCPAMIISCNTTMVHFLLKLNAWTVFASPYAPVTLDPGFFFGQELGMDFSGIIYIVPAASNYVGGDIVSGLLNLDLHKQEQTSMFFDIGTNGELVIGNKDWILAGAGAAGPALEGYISKYGMRAAPGAIDSVTIEGCNLTFTTIGQQRPKGICGSGIIDLLAQMRRNGWVNIAGELNPNASNRIQFLEEEGQFAAVYATAEESATGQPLYFSQMDISQYLDTKAAAYTMIECLLETAGISAEALAHIHLSGAFSAHANLENAITIGMFPDLPREKFHLLTNASLDGAQRLLTDRSKYFEAKALAENIYCIQFASIPDFLIRMQAAKFIPHTNMERYPSMKDLLP